MKFRTVLFCSALFLAAGCNNAPPASATNDPDTGKRPHEFYHYSMWSALVNKVFDGDLTVKEARTKGDIGLGTYNGIDGELILIDGVLYQALSTGEIRLADDTMHIPYLNATFFEKDLSFALNGRLNYDSLRKLVQTHFPSRNFFYAFKIHGTFDSLKLGSLYRQQKPYPQGLDSLMPRRPHFMHANLAGTMIGFYCPDFIGDINVAGFHLHFLSDDKKTGGHVMEFTGENFAVDMEQLDSYHLVLPQTDEFRNVNLEKKFQYGKK